MGQEKIYAKNTGQMLLSPVFRLIQALFNFSKSLIELGDVLVSHLFHLLVHGGEVALVVSEEVHDGFIVSTDSVVPAEVVCSCLKNEVKHFGGVLVAGNLIFKCNIVVSGSYSVEGFSGESFNDNACSGSVLLYLRQALCHEPTVL